MSQLLDSFSAFLGIDLNTLSSLMAILGVIFTIVIWPIKFLIKRKEVARNAENTQIKKLPPKKVKKSFFSIASSDQKSVDNFIDFFNTVDNEIIELDIVIYEDEKELIHISKELMGKTNELISDYLIIWKPYRKFNDDEKANASNSEGFALNIIYTSESDARLFYSHGCWYLKGFFTVLPGFTNMGVCSIPMRAEKVQRRNFP